MIENIIKATPSWGLIILVWIVGLAIVKFVPIKLPKKWAKRTEWKYLPATLVGLAGILMVVLGFQLHQAVQTNAFDLGIFDQAMWNIAYHQTLANTINGFGNSFDHFSPIFYLMAPLYWIWNDARMLILIEIGAVVAGAIPVYRLAKRNINNLWFTLALLFAYMFFIGTQAALAFPFHASIFIAPFLLFAFDYLEQKKWAWHFLFMVLALLTKENVGVYIAVFGLVLILAKREYWKLGLAYLIGGFGWVYLTTRVFEPAILGQPYTFFTYDALGKNQFSAVATIIGSPFYTLSVLLGSPEKVTTIFSLLGGTGLLAVLSPYGLLVLPTLGEKLFSSRELLWGVYFHYGAPMNFGLVLATIDATRRIKRRLEKKPSKWLTAEQWVRLVGVVLVLGTLGVTVHERGVAGRWMKGFLKPYQYKSELQAAIKILPRQGGVAAQDTLVPQISHRSQIYLYGQYSAPVDYILLTTDASTWPIVEGDFKADVKKLLDDPNWGLIYNQGGVMLWQRGAADKVAPSARVKQYLGE